MRGRPRVDKLDHLERVADLLISEPDISPTAVASLLRIRKQDALRIVRALRKTHNGS